jgi:hypothetical protein
MISLIVAIGRDAAPRLLAIVPSWAPRLCPCAGGQALPWSRRRAVPAGLPTPGHCSALQCVVPTRWSQRAVAARGSTRTRSPGPRRPPRSTRPTWPRYDTSSHRSPGWGLRRARPSAPASATANLSAGPLQWRGSGRVPRAWREGTGPLAHGAHDSDRQGVASTGPAGTRELVLKPTAFGPTSAWGSPAGRATQRQLSSRVGSLSLTRCLMALSQERGMEPSLTGTQGLPGCHGFAAADASFCCVASRSGKAARCNPRARAPAATLVARARRHAVAPVCSGGAQGSSAGLLLRGTAPAPAAGSSRTGPCRFGRAQRPCWLRT